MSTWIQGGMILTPDQTFDERVLVIEGGVIRAIEARRELAAHPAETDVLDASGLLIIPGLIDLHVHGGAGADTMDATPEALQRMSAFFLRHGVTSFLPTTMASSPEATARAIENVAQYQASVTGARPLGLHLEGPYLSRAYRGAQPEEWIRDPHPTEYRRWLETGWIRLVTLAPEAPGALEFIREGVRQGVRFSAGHTAAGYDAVRKAADAGLSQSTHTFNGMTGLHHREPGAAGAVLTDDRIRCEIIADGFHLHPAVLQLVARIKGAERTLLVTDAMRAAGLADGEYDLGGQLVSVRDGVARTAAGILAGSTLTLDRAVRNMMEFAGLSINQAVAMATASPAAALGLSGRKGTIQPGADADLLLVDESIHIKAVMHAGHWVH